MTEPLLAALLLLAPAQDAAPADPPFATLMTACKAGGEERCEGSWRGIDYVIWKDLTAVNFTTASKISWNLSCRVDQMEDTIGCTLSNARRGDGPYLMLLWGTEWRGVSIAVSSLGPDGYPNSRDSLRVDKGPLHSIGEDDLWSGAAAAQIIRELRTGALLRLRFYDWPHNVSNDAELPLDGMSAVLDASSAAVRVNGIR
jgi:hypothetical protein